MSDLIYLDYNATTPVDPGVVDRMVPYFLNEYGNPSNTSHRYGWVADEATVIAREQLAALIGATPEEITFTAGATEAVNMAIKGIARTHSSKGKHIVTCATEHAAVLESCRSLQADGYEVTVLPVESSGILSAEAVSDALRDDTILVAVMWANNETGVIHPIQEIARAVSEHSALFLTDATQAVGKVQVRVDGIDLLACSAHKFYGPKGSGALFIRRRRPSIRIAPMIHGGSQEGGTRAGTLNVPGIVGLGAAAEIAADRLHEDFDRLSVLRDSFEAELRGNIPGVHVNGGDVDRLPQTSNVVFPRIDAPQMIHDIDRLAVSFGSACGSGEGKLSHVLLALGLDRTQIKGTIRFSMGRHTSRENMMEAAGLLVAYVNKKKEHAELQD